MGGVITTVEPMAKRELRRRIRELARRAKESQHFPRNYRTEVGLRVRTVVVASAPESVAAAIAEDDDLADFRTLDGWVKSGLAGEVVHLHISSVDTRYSSGEMQDVVMGWVGTSEHEPVLLLRDDQ